VELKDQGAVSRVGIAPPPPHPYTFIPKCFIIPQKLLCSAMWSSPLFC